MSVSEDPSMAQQDLDLSRLKDDAYMAGLSFPQQLQLVQRWKREIQSFDIGHPGAANQEMEEISAWDLPVLGQRVLILAEARKIDSGPAAELNVLCRTGANVELSLVHQALGITERIEARIRAEMESSGGHDTQHERGPTLVLDVNRKTAELDGKKIPLTDRQTEFLKKLIDADGGFVPGRQLKYDNLSDSRVDSLFRGIPDEIRSYVETRRGAGGGYRLGIPGRTIEG